MVQSGCYTTLCEVLEKWRANLDPCYGFYLVQQDMEERHMGQASGPRTIFFWAPITKWGLVIAGLADMTRPAEKLSTGQSAVLMASGFIFSRWSLVIVPRNWSLFAVNFFVGCAGSSQLFRIWRYQQGLKAQATEAKI